MTCGIKLQNNVTALQFICSGSLPIGIGDHHIPPISVFRLSDYLYCSLHFQSPYHAVCHLLPSYAMYSDIFYFNACDMVFQSFYSHNITKGFGRWDLNFIFRCSSWLISRQNDFICSFYYPWDFQNSSDKPHFCGIDFFFWITRYCPCLACAVPPVFMFRFGAVFCLQVSIVSVVVFSFRVSSNISLALTTFFRTV